jgi:hypothetical protein
MIHRAGAVNYLGNTGNYLGNIGKYTCALVHVIARCVVFLGGIAGDSLVRVIIGAYFYTKDLKKLSTVVVIAIVRLLVLGNMG